MTLHFAICFQCQFQHHGKIFFFFFLLAVTVMANLLTFTNMTPIVLNQGWHKQGNPPQSWSQQLHLYCLLTVNRFVILNWYFPAYHLPFVCLLFFFFLFFFCLVRDRLLLRAVRSEPTVELQSDSQTISWNSSRKTIIFMFIPSRGTLSHCLHAAIGNIDF